MTKLKELFEDTFNMLNIIATDTQKEAVFRTSCREFFSYVAPVHFIEFETYNNAVNAKGESIKCGFVDDSNLLSLGMGSIKIIETASLNDCIGVRIKPMDYDIFMLEDGYTGAFQQVVEFMLKKLECDNMRMLKSAGIDDGEGFENEDINALRDYLRKEFSIETARLVE